MSTLPSTSTPFRTIGPDVDLVEDPIPAAWVLEGSPRASLRTWAMSADETTSHWVWDCTAGRFWWYFRSDETVSIIAGSVTIAAEGHGELDQVRLGVGDAAYFPAGTWTVWHVEDYVRKHAVTRIPIPGPLARVVRGLGWRMHRSRLGANGVPPR